jgi:hypothetical protein
MCHGTTSRSCIIVPLMYEIVGYVVLWLTVVNRALLRSGQKSTSGQRSCALSSSRLSGMTAYSLHTVYV